MKGGDGAFEADISATEERLNLTLSPALREWYLPAGHRQDFIGNNDHLLALEDLKIYDDVLIFCFENQGVVAWGVRVEDLELDDPPVLVTDHDTEPPWHKSHDPFSEFMVYMVALATLISGQFSGSGSLGSKAANRLEQEYEQLYARTPSGYKLLGDSDTLIGLTNSEIAGNFDIQVATRTRAAMEHFLDIVGRHWTEISHHAQYWAHDFYDGCSDVPPRVIIQPPMTDPLVKPGVFPPCHLSSRGGKSSGYSWEQLAALNKASS